MAAVTTNRNTGGRITHRSRAQRNLTLAKNSADTPNVNLADKIKDLYEQAKRKRQPRVEQWNRNYRLVHNRVWAPTRAAWLPSPSLSEIYPIVTSITGWMTDTRPEFTCVPTAALHSQYSEMYGAAGNDLTTCLMSTWTDNNFDAEIEKTVFDMLIYGIGIFKSMWDGSAQSGLGNAVMRRVDPYSFFPDPQATSMNDANYFIETRNISIQELDRRFPGSAAKFSSMYRERIDERDDPMSGGGNGPPMANPAALPGGTNWYGLPGQSNRDNVYLDEGVTVYEAWVREHDVKPGPKNPDGTPGDDLIIDQWRVIVCAGPFVLMNELALDLWGHGRHPYSRCVMHDIGDFWGISIVEHLAPLQIHINRLLTAFQMNVELIGNPILLEDQRAGIQRTQIVNKPGQRLTKNAGSEVRWLDAPPIPPYFSQLIEFYLREMERISGLSAISRGMAPAGRNSTDVMDSLVEAGFVRIRLGLRNLERALEEQGNLLASLITENYTQPRLISIVGPSGERTMTMLNTRHFYLPSANDPENPMPIQFNLHVEAHSSLPTSRAAKFNQAAQLFAMGAIDAQAVLEVANYPNRWEILARVNAMKQAGMFEPPGQRQRTR